MDGEHTEESSRAPLLGLSANGLGRQEDENEEEVPTEPEKSSVRSVRFLDEVVTDTGTPKNLERVVDIDDPHRNTRLARMLSHPRDELRYFRNGLRCLGLDQSTRFKVALSWILFILFTFIVPFVNLTSVSCPDCDPEHRHPFEGLVQIAETSLAAVSFLCLSHIVRRHGLRRTLLLDRIVRESVEVRTGYESELHVSPVTYISSFHSDSVADLFSYFAIISWSFFFDLLRLVDK